MDVITQNEYITVERQNSMVQISLLQPSHAAVDAWFEAVKTAADGTPPDQHFYILLNFVASKVGASPYMQ